MMCAPMSDTSRLPTLSSSLLRPSFVDVVAVRVHIASPTDLLHHRSRFIAPSIIPSASVPHRRHSAFPSPPCLLVMQTSQKNDSDSTHHRHPEQTVSSSISSPTPASPSDPLIPPEIQCGPAPSTSAPPSSSSSAMRSSSSAHPSSSGSTGSSSNMTRLKIAGGIFGTLIIGIGVLAATGRLSTDTFLSLAAYFENMGPSAIYYYALLYFFLELVAVPALPLTLGSGYLFGVTRGTIAVSISSSLAAAAAFLIARYALRDAVMSIAQRYPRFRAIDRAISREGFKFVFLLRLSPLLPFSISNYLYGLTSVPFPQFTVASWLGMLPGTIAYVSAGAAVSALQDIGSGSTTKVNPFLLGIGLLATIAALTLGGRAAQRAIAEIEEEDEEIAGGGLDSIPNERVDKRHP